MVIGSSADFILVLINNGSGMFTTGPRISAGEHPKRVAASDLDANGHPDIIAYNHTSKTLRVSWGLQDGVFGGKSDGEDKFTQWLLDNRIIIGT